MQNFRDLYGELATKLTDNITELRWVDLWHNQVSFLETEHPFPTPAVFLGFRSQSMTDAGLKVQNVTLQVDVFVFYETFLDTFKGAYNQEDALDFLDILDNINKLFHASSGANYSSMRRVNFGPVDTGGSGNLWNITYTCTMIDYSAMDEFEEGSFDDVNVNKFIIPLDD